MQNQPGRIYHLLTKVGATLEWQQNYFAEIEAETARMVERRERNRMNNRIGCELQFLHEDGAAGFQNTVAAAIELMESALAEINRAIAAIPPIDWNKVRLHAWER